MTDRSLDAIEARRLYKTKRWHVLRNQALARDGFTCQMCGRILTGHHRKGAPSDDHAPDVDHIRPHDGDPDTFFDLDNLQSLCHSPCHAKHKQRQDHDRQTLDDDGWPIDERYTATRT